MVVPNPPTNFTSTIAYVYSLSVNSPGHVRQNLDISGAYKKSTNFIKIQDVLKKTIP